MAFALSVLKIAGIILLVLLFLILFLVLVVLLMPIRYRLGVKIEKSDIPPGPMCFFGRIAFLIPIFSVRISYLFLPKKDSSFLEKTGDLLSDFRSDIDKNTKIVCRILFFRPFEISLGSEKKIHWFSPWILLILRRVWIRKISGELTFGFDSPDRTGKITALFASTFPIHKNRVKIHPDFHRSVCFGHLYLEGRFALIKILYPALRFYLENLEKSAHTDK